METITNFDSLLKEVRWKISEQALALKELTAIFADEARKLIQHDQVACLNDLKASIMKEVEHIQRIETAACTEFNKVRIGTGLAAFGLGALFGVARGGTDPVSSGAKWVKSVLDERVPFGTILITVGKGGLPGDVRVTPVSCLARQSHIDESEVKARLQGSGCLFMTPEKFVRVLTKIQSRLLDGSMSLPVPIEQLTREMREGA